MKKTCMYLLILGMIFPLFAQEKISDVFYESGELPAVVLKKAGEEFSVYYPDNSNPDSRVLELQSSFISYNLGKDFEGHDSYLLVLEVEGGMLSATFNDTGKLLSVVERYENAKLPKKVRLNLAKKYPEWTLVRDKFLYVQKYGEVKRKQYKIIMKKDNKIKRIVVDSEGELIRG
ncbi:MAG: hypothetical protein ACPG45_02500 [Flavobacteriaceae bacterium]